MTLHEEQKKQNERTWLSHFERERSDLSASVEAALIDANVHTKQWQDEFDEEEHAQSVTSGTSLIPPRLSLQSISLPIVQPEPMGTPSTDAYQAIPSPIVEETEQTSSQTSGMLARLARRFTSSFMAVKGETPSHQAPLQSSEQALSQEREAYYQPSLVQPSQPATQVDMPLVRVVENESTMFPILRQEETSGEPRQQRLLKRNGKVRLETTEQPALVRPSMLPVQEQETGEALLSEVKAALNQQQEFSQHHVEREQQSIRYDDVLKAGVPTFLSGSGRFEGEQSEVMIANEGVVETSVVLVTLTTNPGPVVVQYISLQPRIGFTVHLTAPVAMRTEFNYVIMAGEPD